MEKKSVIFIHPLSNNLAKLHEILSENAEADRIEIYECENLAEAVQVVPNLAPALCLGADARTIAKFLHSTYKQLKKKQNKTILITNKRLPMKAQKKMDKLGLTDVIIEPIAPKTLLYKIKIQIRALPSKKTQDEMEYKSGNDLTMKKGEEGDDKGMSLKRRMALAKEKEEGSGLQLFDKDSEDDNEKKNLEFGDIYDDEKKGKKKSSSGIDLGLDDEDEGRLSNTKADEIDNKLRGETSGLDLDLEDEEEKKNKTVALDLFNDEEDEEKPDLDLDLEEEEEDKKGSLDLDLEEEEDSSDKSSLDLELEEEEEDSGKSSLDLDLEEEDKEDKGALDLDLEEESPELEIELDDEGPKGEINDKSGSGLDLDLESEEEEEKAKLDLELENEEELEKENLDLDLEAEEELDKEKLDLELEAEEEKTKDSLDLDLEEEEEKKKDSLNLDLEEESLNDEKPKLDLDIEDEESDKGDGLKLELEEEEAALDYSEHKKKMKEEREREGSLDLDLEEENDKKDKPNLDLDIEEENKDSDFSGLDLDMQEEEKKKNSAAKLELEPEQDDGWDGMSNEKEELNQESKKPNIQLELEEDDDLKTLDPIAQKEQRSVDREERKTEIDDDWSYEADNNLDDDWGNKKRQGSTLNYGDDIEGVGDVLNYEKIKKQHEAMERKNKTPEEIAEEKKQEEIIAARDAVLNSEVFDPSTKGLEYTIKALDFYYDKKAKDEELMTFLAESIFKEKYGKTSFFIKDKDSGRFEIVYSGHTELPDTRPKEELKAEWEEAQAEKYEQWKDVNTPLWSDETFQAKEIDFIYPFYESSDHMGFAVTSFTSGFSQNDTSFVETILETSRGIFLEYFHENIKPVDSGAKKSNEKVLKPEGETTGKKIVGFFKGLFGRKKAS